MKEADEIGVSALLDAELAHHELLEVIDQLVEDPELRDFYRHVRGLDLRLLEAGVARPVQEEALAELWERIEQQAMMPQEAGEVLDARRRFRRVPAWLMATAAAAALAVGVWIGARPSAPMLTSEADLGEVVNIQLAADAGAMDDDRFVELTAELLRADRRYHQAMEQIISAVNARSTMNEGLTEGLAPLDDFDNEIRPVALRQDGGANGEPRVWD